MEETLPIMIEPLPRPFEALGAGDPQVKVAEFLEKIRQAFGL